MATWNRRQRLIALALAAAVLASMILVQATTMAGSEREMLFNGNFEQGFDTITGCGAVGKGWGCFTNGGSIVYGFYDDQWAPVVANGQNSQLIELNTLQFAASEANRYAGIFQTVHLAPGCIYKFSLQGLMRERNPNPKEDAFRYRVQWGYTQDGSQDWTQVSNWQELPWDKIDDRLTPSGLQSYSTTFVAPANGTITLFVRVWKKWGTAYKELDVNLDAISLVGPGPIYGPVPHQNGDAVVVPPANGGAPYNQPNDNGGNVIVVPPAPANPVPINPSGAQQANTCDGPNLVRNGSFEKGFVGGAVGRYWGYFNNGGLANYGYYDDQWPPVIHDGANSQFLEINTKGMPVGDADRWSGIYQVVGRLRPGDTYEFSMWGLLREEAAHPNEDAFRYRVQWGYAANANDGSSNFTDINNWTDVPWNSIYLRTDPGPMLPFSVQLQAPSSSMVVGIRALKKWGTPYRELDVNLDAIRLTPCGSPPPPPEILPCQVGQYCGPSNDANIGSGSHDPWSLEPPKPDAVVIAGNSQGEAPPPDVIVIDSNNQPEPPPPANPVIVNEDNPAPVPPDPPAAAGSAACAQQYTIKRGDSLSVVAARFGTSAGALATANAITNPNLILAGQVICVK